MLATPTAAAPCPLPMAAGLPVDDDTPPGGCGWFDSSLDLSRGLAVVEHAGFEALADIAPVAWQLAAWSKAMYRAG